MVDPGFRCAVGESVESFGDVDLAVEGVESPEFGAVLRLPVFAGPHPGFGLRASLFEVGELLLVPADLFGEVVDSVFEVDYKELSERLSINYSEKRGLAERIVLLRLLQLTSHLAISLNSSSMIKSSSNQGHSSKER